MLIGTAGHIDQGKTALAKELKRRGFRFVGPTVIYSHMQATGMVNDHLVTCPRHKAVTAAVTAC